MTINERFEYLLACEILSQEMKSHIREIRQHCVIQESMINMMTNNKAPKSMKMIYEIAKENENAAQS